jgi:hypothetical protein
VQYEPSAQWSWFVRQPPRRADVAAVDAGMRPGRPGRGDAGADLPLSPCCWGGDAVGRRRRGGGAVRIGEVMGSALETGLGLGSFYEQFCPVLVAFRPTDCAARHRQQQRRLDGDV